MKKKVLLMGSDEVIPLLPNMVLKCILESCDFFLLPCKMVIMHFLASCMVRVKKIELCIPRVFHVFTTIRYYGSIIVVKMHFISHQYFHQGATLKNTSSNFHQ
jgi:hypothetical protein